MVSLLLASSARAAFPGANGLLAVQPVSGDGIVLVAPNGQHQHRICRSATLCGSEPAGPRWSPDGRSLVVGGSKITLVYPDGSCLNCQFAEYTPEGLPIPSGSHAASFMRSGAVLSVVQNGTLLRYGIDGLPQDSPRVSDVSDAMWSADGQLAVVRGGWVWAGRPGRLRKVARGNSPSWAPRGDRLVAVQRDWVVILGRHHHAVRLARGSAPTFSPNGRWVAFVRPDQRLMIVSAVRKHARPRPVGTTLAVSVDWQPKPRGHRPACVAPPGSRVAASSPMAAITAHVEGGPPPKPTSEVYMGCLRADGRERFLKQLSSIDYVASTVRSLTLAAPYAGLVVDDDNYKYQDHSSAAEVFDLRTGKQQTQLGGEGAGVCAYSSGSGFACDEVDQLVLGSDGVSAAHTEQAAPVGWRSSPLVEVTCAPAGTLCIASDHSGPGRLLTSNDPVSGAPSWSAGSLPPPALYSPGELACPSPSLCVAAANGIFTSASPRGGASTWTAAGVPGNADGVSCPSTGLCVASFDNGSVGTSTDPAGGGGAWSISAIDPNHALNAVVCSTAPRCFISDSSQTVFTSGNPTGGASAWTASSTTPQFSSGACPTPSLCVTVSYRGIATTTDPSGGTWTQQSVPTTLNSVSCPSASLCVAVGYQGALYLSTDPASGTWSGTTIDNGRRLNWISCASVSLCVAVDQTGHVVTSTNPTGGPSAWTPALIDGDPCNDTSVCSVETIQTSDKTGIHKVDSSAISGTGPYLTGLTLTGDTVAWRHNGGARSTTLTP